MSSSRCSPQSPAAPSLAFAWAALDERFLPVALGSKGALPEVRRAVDPQRAQDPRLSAAAWEMNGGTDGQMDRCDYVKEGCCSHLLPQPTSRGP